MRLDTPRTSVGTSFGTRNQWSTDLSARSQGVLRSIIAMISCYDIVAKHTRGPVRFSVLPRCPCHTLVSQLAAQASWMRTVLRMPRLRPLVLHSTRCWVRISFHLSPSPTLFALWRWVSRFRSKRITLSRYCWKCNNDTKRIHADRGFLL